MKLRYDLHSHSDCSDGTLSPEQLVERAKLQQVDVLALTDHDTIAGVTRAQQAAASAGLTLIPASEISAKWNKKDIHIIALAIDIENQLLQEGLQRHQQKRETRAEAMGDRLAELGIKGAYAGAKKICGKALLTRPHFAKFLIEQGHVSSFNDAFKRYLAAGKPGYVVTPWASMEEVVRWIRAAGGQAVLAHPTCYKLTSSQLRHLLRDFKEVGGVGLEVVTSYHNADETQRMATLAASMQLFASVGSDFHGIAEKRIELGQLRPLPGNCKPIWQLW